MKPTALRALLCVAHPGHELRVYGWLARARPRVLVLTDGSGRSGRSRVPATLETLEETGAEPGPILGALTDTKVYEAIVSGDALPFTRLLDAVADEILAGEVTLVAGDAIEGYNPMHDLCRLILNGAVTRARRRGRAIANFEFPLTAHPAPRVHDLPAQCIELRLDEALFARKLAAARREADLGVDVDLALRTHGREAFRVERLRPAAEPLVGDGLPEEPPFYERHGERRVKEGKYRVVLRRGEHLLPIARALRLHAEAGR
jgi:hypothetical protein